jgi:hypothetical protein
MISKNLRGFSTKCRGRLCRPGHYHVEPIGAIGLALGGGPVAVGKVHMSMVDRTGMGGGRWRHHGQNRLDLARVLPVCHSKWSSAEGREQGERAEHSKSI